MSYWRAAENSEIKLDWDLFRMLLPYVWGYKGRMLVALLMLILAKVATVSVPMVLKYAVDALDKSAHATLALPLGLLVGYGALRFASSAFQELRDTIFAKMRYGIMREISMQVLERLYDLSLRFHLDRKTGAVTRDIHRGTSSISTLLNYLVFRIVPTLIEIALVAGILLTGYSAWFAAIVVGTFIIYAGLTLGVTEWRLKYRRAMNEAESQANSRAIDGLLNYETVKYFGNEDYELNRYDEDLQEWQESAYQSQATLSMLNITQQLTIAFGVTGIMVLAAQGVVDGRMTVGDLVAVNAYLLQVFMPLGFLGMIYSIVKHALSDMERMFGILERDPEVEDAEDAVELDITGGEIAFEEVSFGYDDDREVLHGVDFRIPAGHKLAVVGPSGAGKSTLARLLYRFYDVDEGRILIDGQEVGDCTQASVRATIGVVPQDTVLFNDTIRYNIHYGNLEATDEEVVEAARHANIHEFIESLPDGYETVVGERGLKLSGGEKQRVAIARALLKDPEIMIFDEATSSLDSENERAILEALDAVAVDRTTLAIAHRLSTIVDADEILVMRKGEVVERGRHGELLEADGTYAAMWELQQSGEEGEEVALEEAVGE